MVTQQPNPINEQVAPPVQPLVTSKVIQVIRDGEWYQEDPFDFRSKQHSPPYFKLICFSTQDSGDSRYLWIREWYEPVSFADDVETDSELCYQIIYDSEEQKWKSPIREFHPDVPLPTYETKELASRGIAKKLGLRVDPLKFSHDLWRLDAYLFNKGIFLCDGRYQIDVSKILQPVTWEAINQLSEDEKWHDEARRAYEHYRLDKKTYWHTSECLTRLAERTVEENDSHIFRQSFERNAHL